MKDRLKQATGRNLLLVITAGLLILGLLNILWLSQNHVAWIYHSNINNIAMEAGWSTRFGGVLVSKDEIADYVRFQLLIGDVLADETNTPLMNKQSPSSNQIQQLIDRRLVLTDARTKGLLTQEDISSHRQVLLNWLMQYVEEKGHNWEDMINDHQISLKTVLNELTLEVAIKHMQSKQGETIQVTDQDIEDFYTAHANQYMLPKQIKITHIFSQKKENISNLWHALNEGELSLDLLKVRHDLLQEDMELTQEWVKHGQLSEDLDMEVFAMTSGQLRGMVETREGYHIIKVEDIISARPQALADIRSVVAKDTQRFREKSAWLAYLAQLRGASQIVTLHP